MAANLKFTYVDYYKYLSTLQKFFKVTTLEQAFSLLNSTLDGDIVSVIDVENLFFGDLGVKLGSKKILNEFEQQFALTVSYAFWDYYSLNDVEEEKEIIDLVGWTVAGSDVCYPFNKIILSDDMFQNFKLIMTEDGNVLQYASK